MPIYHSNTHHNAELINPTHFVGHLFKPDSKIYTRISNLNQCMVNTFKDDFTPREYPHVTLVYTGNNINKSHIQQIGRQINLFKNQLCKFRKLDFYGKTLVYVFDFENCQYNNSMLELVNSCNSSELESHGDKRLHIAIGKFANNKAKQLFCDNLMDDVTKLIKGIYSGTYKNTNTNNKINMNAFTFDNFHLVTVDHLKKYTATIL